MTNCVTFQAQNQRPSWVFHKCYRNPGLSCLLQQGCKRGEESAKQRTVCSQCRLIVFSRACTHKLPAQENHAHRSLSVTKLRLNLHECKNAMLFLASGGQGLANKPLPYSAHCVIPTSPRISSTQEFRSRCITVRIHTYLLLSCFMHCALTGLASFGWD